MIPFPTPNPVRAVAGISSHTGDRPIGPVKPNLSGGIRRASDEVARIIGHEVRDTDLIGSTDTGLISLALLDADYENGTRVIDRLVQRIDDYEFITPLRISVGAACYPTHAVDSDSLKQQALSHPVVNWRGGSPASRPTRHHQH